MKRIIKITSFITLLFSFTFFIETADHIQEHKNLNLRVAVIGKSLSRVKNALEKGAERDTFNSCGFTPLLAAARDNSSEIASLLITEKATVDFQGSNKMTALHMAARYKSIDVIKILLKAGADRSLEDSFQKKAVDYAVEKNAQEVVCLLELE